MKTSGLFCRRKKKRALRSCSHISDKLHSEDTVTYINDFLLHRNCHYNMTVLQPPWSVPFVVFLYRSPRKGDSNVVRAGKQTTQHMQTQMPLLHGSFWEGPKRTQWFVPLGLRPLPPALFRELCCVPAIRFLFLKRKKKESQQFMKKKWSGNFPAWLGINTSCCQGFPCEGQWLHFSTVKSDGAPVLDLQLLRHSEIFLI